MPRPWPMLQMPGMLWGMLSEGGGMPGHGIAADLSLSQWLAACWLALILGLLSAMHWGFLWCTAEAQGCSEPWVSRWGGDSLTRGPQWPLCRCQEKVAAQMQSGCSGMRASQHPRASRQSIPARPQWHWAHSIIKAGFQINMIGYQIKRNLAETTKRPKSQKKKRDFHHFSEFQKNRWEFLKHPDKNLAGRPRVPPTWAFLLQLLNINASSLTIWVF